jgi:putative transposase
LGERLVIADNVLDRQFIADRPNQERVTNFIKIWTADGWPHVAAVIDLFSPRVVGWSLGDTKTALLVTDALIMAIWRRGKPDALLHLSDQGTQYRREQFQRLMADNGVTCAMSRSANFWDNAAMGSFYNPTPSHTALAYLRPIDFERGVGVARMGGLSDYFCYICYTFIKVPWG